MAINQYLPFAIGVGANTLPFSAYAALTTIIEAGYQAGTAESVQCNTTWRQATVGVAALAQFAANRSGQDLLDDGSVLNFKNSIELAIMNLLKQNGALMEVGAVAGFIDVVNPGNPPAGWIKAAGQAVSRVTFAALFVKLGIFYGPGDGSTTFNLPDLRGEFIRGLDDGRGIDPGRTIDQWQDFEIQSHQHTSFRGLAPTNSSTGSIGGDNPYEGLTGPSGGSETRPRNMPVLWCIKY